VAKVTIKVKMQSSAGTGYYITTTKNPRTHPEKMKFKRYDPVVRKHVMFDEKKVK